MKPSPPPTGTTPFFGRIVRPLIERRRGMRHARFVPYYTRFFRRSPEELREQQLHDLRAILRHAQGACPFYARRFADAGFDPEQVTSAKDLRRIPTLSRHDIVNHVDEMVSTLHDKSKLITRKTGGTVNVPVPFFQDREAIARKHALERVFREAMGRHQGMRTAWLWGAAQDVPAKDRPRFQAFKEDWINRHVFREFDMDAGALSDEQLDRHIEALQRFRPHALQGYPVATDLVAQRALARGIQLQVPLVILTAEPVIPAHRERIGEAFQANVLSFYGSRENGWITYDHPETQEMLINTASVVLESDPETNELFVTDLLNHGMPLIRYEIGDRGRLSDEPARCGDPRPVLASVDGRTADVVILPSGKRVPGVIADYRGLVLDPEGFTDVQLVQRDLHTMEVYYVPGPHFKQAALDVYVERMGRYFHGELQFQAHAVDRIAPGPNGKVRSLISMVSEA